MEEYNDHVVCTYCGRKLSGMNDICGCDKNIKYRIHRQATEENPTREQAERGQVDD